MSDSPGQQSRYFLRGEVLEIDGDFTFRTIHGFIQYCRKTLPQFSGEHLTIDIEGIRSMDSGGVTAINFIRKDLEKRGIGTTLSGGSSRTRKKLDVFSEAEAGIEEESEELVRKAGYFEKLGKRSAEIFNKYVTSFFKLMSEITYWTFAGLFTKRAYRKGEVSNQAVLMGVNAALIVGMMSFIIGLVLALQSAAQLRSFGANIYIVDLTVIAMMSEMGPLITAIMVAGRSGSSIAAEIATMKVTSETDALKTMGVIPVRFIVVPKMYGGLLTMPFLTILADVLGIMGGMLIAGAYLDIAPVVFLNRMGDVLYLRDIIFGVVKSLVFIYLIVISGSYFGFSASKVDSGVGRVTTSAVVFSIALVIFADSIMGLFFY